MRLHLDHPVGRFQQPIAHQDQILMMGSCFSEHIGQRLAELRFLVLSNPFGIVFNPRSMALALERIRSQTLFAQSDLVLHNGLWHCWEAHGAFSGPDPVAVLQVLNTHLLQWHAALQQARWLVLTFGSAYVYNHTASNRYVANCHKLPQAAFNKELLSPQAIAAELGAVLQSLRELNPHLQFLFTVSPVKHLRDGLIENNLSKATLILAAHTLCQHLQGHYFPAYELITDDLRDYRFFDTDMAHPNAQAIGYVWQKFSEAAFTKETQALNEELSALLREQQHRPLRPDSQQYAQFKEAHAQKWEALIKRFPFLRAGT